MAGVLGPNSGFAQSPLPPPPPRWPLASEDLAVFTLGRLFSAEVVKSKPRRPVSRGKRPPPHFGPFQAYPRTLPLEVEMLV